VKTNRSTVSLLAWLGLVAAGCATPEELAEVAQPIDAQSTGLCSTTNEIAVEWYRSALHELGRVAPGRDYVNYFGRLALTQEGLARCASRSGCPQVKSIIDMQRLTAQEKQLLSQDFPWAPYLDTALLSKKLVGAMLPVSDPIGGTLGFEATTTVWSSSSAALSSSSDAQSGTVALAINAANYNSITSEPMSSVGSVSSAATLWIKLPSPQSNPWYYGAVQMYVTSPSTNHYNVYVGQRELTGLPLGSYQMLSFPLSADLQNWLKGPYNDLRVTLVLNVPAGNGTYLIDGLSFGTPTPTSSYGSTPEAPAPSNPVDTVPFVDHLLTFTYVTQMTEPRCASERYHCFSVAAAPTNPNAVVDAGLVKQYLLGQMAGQSEVLALADSHVDPSGNLCIDPAGEVGIPGTCADGNLPQYRTGSNLGACCVKDGLSGHLVQHERFANLLVCR